MSGNDSPLPPISAETQRAIRRFLEEKKKETGERRSNDRVPFFSQVTIVKPVEGRQFSCFSRDISPMGIGLLHYSAVELGEVVLRIPRGEDSFLRVKAVIRWCAPCGEGWYLAGASFLEVL